MAAVSVLTSAPVHLTYAGGLYDRTAPLATGEVRPEGIDLNYVPVVPPEAFWRQLQYGEFDVSELSCANYFTLLSRGDRRFIAIPVYPSRTFRHSAVYVNPEKGVRRPEELKGKRVGCAEYFMTMAIWQRAFLMHDYGVMPGDMTWVLGGVEQPGRRERIPVSPPAGVRVEQAPPDRSLSDLLLAGELDALLSPHMPQVFRRGDPRITRLFPEFWKVEREYYERHKVFPIMHTVCFKREVYERYPWAAVSLYKAFCQAKDLALERMYDSDALTVSLAWLVGYFEQERALRGADLWSYGFHNNRHDLETLKRHLAEQELLENDFALEEAFAPSTLETFKQ
jgi:4,5-dihydroxyphthalate decarboxylase